MERNFSLIKGFEEFFPSPGSFWNALQLLVHESLGHPDPRWPWGADRKSHFGPYVKVLRQLPQPEGRWQSRTEPADVRSLYF
jgi:hypothetical protein